MMISNEFKTKIEVKEYIKDNVEDISYDKLAVILSIMIDRKVKVRTGGDFVIQLVPMEELLSDYLGK